MIKINFSIGLLALIVYITGCAYSNNEKHLIPDGISYEKYTEVFHYSIGYITSLQRLTQLGVSEDQPHSSLLTQTRQSLAFNFTITPRKDRATGDVIYSQVHSYEDYQQRVEQLNFGFHQYWELRTSTDTVPAIAAQMDNTYSLTDYRKFQILFAPQDTSIHLHEAPYWEVVFMDEVFETGVHTFRFERAEWETVEGMD